MPVELTCENCGDVFTRPPCQAGQSYCSRECQKEDHRTTSVCDCCGSEFRHRKRRENPRFCDKDCEAEWRQNNQSKGWVGECSSCGEGVERKPSNVPESGRVYCSVECYGEHKSVLFSGEGNPLWKGGHPDYGSEWASVSERVRERDGYRCQSCGVRQEDLPRKLDVHHVTPVRHFDSPNDANSDENLVSLCRSCHQKWEGVPVRPSLAGTRG
jgi:5-methylcytosine-specific restriction endonuclease McrA